MGRHTNRHTEESGKGIAFAAKIYGESPSYIPLPVATRAAGAAGSACRATRVDIVLPVVEVVLPVLPVVPPLPPELLVGQVWVERP